MVSFSYRRPAYVPATVGANVSTEEKEKFLNDSRGSGRSGRSDGIPEELSLDNIVSNNACPVSRGLIIHSTNGSIANNKIFSHALLAISSTI